MDKYKKSFFYLLICFFFILGIFLRAKLYIINNVFGDDECRLAITMFEKSSLQMFMPLGDAQSAPPLFMFVSKCLTNILGYSEIVLKFLPFISGIASIFVFYLLCKDYFSKKISLIISTFLLVINYNSIVYSAVFKQYSVDILFSILCLYFLPKINILHLNLKKKFLLSLCMILIPLISLPTIFFIAGFIVINIINNFKDENFYKSLILVLIPFILSMFIYYKFNLLPSKIDMDRFFPDYWRDGFWNGSLSDLVRVLILNLKFDFFPNKWTLFQFLLLIWGIILCLVDKTMNRSSLHLILVTIVFVLFATLLHIYPILGRVGLFLLPLLIIVMVLPLERSVFPKFNYWIALLFIILSFYKNIPFFSNISEEELFGYSPKNLMIELKNNFDKDNDIILCNSASSASFIFYSSMYNLNTDRVYKMDFDSPKEQLVFEYLNNLERNQNYWLYMIKDYKHAPVMPYINKWLVNKKILYYKKEKNSILIYFEN